MMTATWDRSNDSEIYKSKLTNLFLSSANGYRFTLVDSIPRFVRDVSPSTNIKSAACL